MFCKNCGKEIDDNAYVCPHCGVKQEDDEVVQEISREPNNLVVTDFSIIGFILSFFVPIVGLILCLFSYCNLKVNHQNENHEKFALAGLIIAAVFVFISSIVFTYMISFAYFEII